jgi:hypothetical protein
VEFKGHFTGSFGHRKGQGQAIDFIATDLLKVWFAFAIQVVLLMRAARTAVPADTSTNSRSTCRSPLRRAVRAVGNQ